MKNFRELAVWEKSHHLTLDVYRTSQSFPRDEIYGLISQIRRASASIPANIAEGCGRGSDLDFARFIQIAFGSATELEYHLLLAHDLGYLKEDIYNRLNLTTCEVKQMLTGLLKKLKGDR